MKKLIGMFVTTSVAVVLSSCDAPTDINVYTRDTSSGTRDGFFSGIGFSEAKTDNSVLVDGFIEVSGNGPMINSINRDSNGIGYIGLSSFKESGLKGLKFNGVNASEENVILGDYKLTRNFNWVLRSDWSSQPSGTEEIAEAYIAYMNTYEGRAVIENKGGIVIEETLYSWDDIKDQYPICGSDNSGLTLKIGGSTSVKDITDSLNSSFISSCGNVVIQANHTGSSDAWKGTYGSNDNLHIGFASREFNDSESIPSGYRGVMNVDAIVAVVNTSNTYVSDVDSETLRKIYDGTYTHWTDIYA